MPNQDFYNSDGQTRYWNGLRDPITLSTLQLGPGEVVENLFVPWGFEDPYLKPLLVSAPLVQDPGPVEPDEPEDEPEEVTTDPPPAEDSPAEPSEEG
jgi:hypothetical protein